MEEGEEGDWLGHDGGAKGCREKGQNWDSLGMTYLYELFRHINTDTL